METMLNTTAFEQNADIMWLLLTPLLAAVAALGVKRPNMRESIIVIIALALFGQCLRFYPEVMHDIVHSYTLWQVMPGVEFAFKIDALGLLFALVASGLWAVTTLYASGYMHSAREKNLPRFFFFFAIAIMATMGLAFSANLLTMFLFYEVLTLSTVPLVTHSGTDKARQAGRVYLGILLSTSILFLLTAILITYHATGTGDFVYGGFLADHVTPAMGALLLFLFVYGVGKAALMPIHRWLPAAMVAPTPVSALLHAVAVVKAGIFVLIKIILFVFGTETLANWASNSFFSGQWLLYVASFTVVMASVVALRKDNLKARLAYSTISQLSYMVLALSLFSPLGAFAAMFHIVAHAVSKITLFFAAGAIYTASKKTLVSQLDGVGRRMPWTMLAFTIGALSMIGIPPAVGFSSKYFLLSAAMETEQWIVLGVLIISTLLNTAYFMPIVIRAYFAPEPKQMPAPIKRYHREANIKQVVALLLTASLSLLIFFFPGDITALIDQVLAN